MVRANTNSFTIGEEVLYRTIYHAKPKLYLIDTLYAITHGIFKAHFWTQGSNILYLETFTERFLGGQMYTIPGIVRHDPPLLFNIMVPSSVYYK